MEPQAECLLVLIGAYRGSVFHLFEDALRLAMLTG
jgi:hypothetical protein